MWDTCLLTATWWTRQTRFWNVWSHPKSSTWCNSTDVTVSLASVERTLSYAVVENIRSYLSEVMRTRGFRTKKNERAFRTVVAACSGHNIVKNKKLTATSSVLVSFVGYKWFPTKNHTSEKNGYAQNHTSEKNGCSQNHTSEKIGCTQNHYPNTFFGCRVSLRATCVVAWPTE